MTVTMISAFMISPLQAFAAAPNGFGDDSQVKDDPFNIPNAED